MATFNPERYLRLLGERVVVRDHRGVVGRRAEDLFEAASALVTCGVMEDEAAWRVLDDYAAALGLQAFRELTAGEPFELRPTELDAAHATAELRPLSTRRVFATDVELPSRHGLGRLQLHWIVLTGSRVTVRLTATAPRALSSADPMIELTTPDGLRIHAVCSSVVEPGLVGDFEALATLDRDADWLAIDGTRVDLTPAGVPAHVVIEDRPPIDPATALIWQLLADVSDPRGEPSTGEPALDALRAAGVIADDDPQIPAIAWARRYAPPAQRSSWTPQPVPSLTEPPATVPEEWRRLADTRGLTFTGPSRTIPVGAVTPVFDGFAIALDLVRSGSTSLALEVEVSGLNLNARWRELRRRPLAFWARDDLGHHYLGRRIGWSNETELGAQATGHGTVVFTALHPSASRLTVIAMSARTRASIEIPL